MTTDSSGSLIAYLVALAALLFAIQAHQRCDRIERRAFGDKPSLITISRTNSEAIKSVAEAVITMNGGQKQP